MTQKKVFMLFVAMSIAVMNFAQVEVKWSHELSSNIQWQEVSSLGNLIVCTDAALMGVDEEDGEIIWKKDEHAGITRDMYRELPNSPFFTVRKNNVVQAMDQFSGDEVFNSIKAGITTITTYKLLYKSNSILVAGKNANDEALMLSVNMSNGQLEWTLNEEFGRIIATNELANEELLIVTLFNNYKLKARSGEIIWKESTSKEAAQVASMGKFGAMMMKAAENMSADQEIKMDYFYRPGDDVFYLGSEQQHQSSMTTSSGEPTYSYTNHYIAYNLSDGKMVWDKDLEVKGKLSQVAFLDEGLLVLPDDGNRTKINLYDYKTQEGKWGKKGKGIAVKGGIYDYLDAGDGILLVSHTSSNDFLNYLDPKAGIITFEKPVKVDGSVVGIVPLNNGILYITTESMNILDPSTGTLKWKKSVRTRPELTAEHGGKIYAYDMKTGWVVALDKESHSLTNLSKGEIAFQGKEAPKKLEVMSDGVFVHSDQNVAKVGFDGELKFNQYYAAPREAGWKRALLIAEGIRASYIAASSYYISGSMAAAEDEVRAEDEVAGEIVNQMGNAYGELGNAASSYAGAAFKQASARMKATQSGRDFMMIMSMVDKEIVLLKVSKNSGEIEGKIALGKDREPNYSVDDITGQVFYRPAGNELTSYTMK